ncbi:hypothetical protein IID21_05055 [Patescibacteria group bacterium]|nr:hypothetical protein [Patescibacteria group bacterium]
MTELVHPTGRNKEVSFSDFEPFIKTGDTPPEVKLRFTVFLQELFNQTKVVWVPGSCYSTQWMEEHTKKILRESRFSGIKVEPRHWARAHFWLVATVEGFDKELIIDPTGVVTPGEDHYQRPETIVPFFGLKNLAPSNSKYIYGKGEPLGKEGYHVFHP